MLDYKLKIGLVPERRFLPGPKRTGIFNPDYAVANKNRIIPFIKSRFGDENTEFVDLEWLNEEGLLFLESDCEKVAERFRAEKVDAIFIINCNFGNEEAAGKIARLMNVPVLLYAPRDLKFEADGTRYTDAQCGVFAISKQLKRQNIPFSYIENCLETDSAFSDGVDKFLSVACMVKNFKNLTVALVGTRLRPFKSVMCNETELTEKFGISTVTVNMAEALNQLEDIYLNRRKKLEEYADKYSAAVDVSSVPREQLVKMMAFVEFYKDIDREYNPGVIATECWTAMQPGFGAMPCVAMSILADEGILVTCESDVHGAITNAVLSAAARGKKPPLFGEFTCRNPHDDNGELLWHCGPFPMSAKAEDSRAYLYNARPSFRVKDGKYTISRFQGERGKYYLFAAEAETGDGPFTFGTYMWAEFKDLPALERKLVEGPYIHHMSELSGSWYDVLKEFAKYVPELIFEGWMADGKSAGH